MAIRVYYSAGVMWFAVCVPPHSLRIDTIHSAHISVHTTGGTSGFQVRGILHVVHLNSIKHSSPLNRNGPFTPSDRDCEPEIFH